MRRGDRLLLLLLLALLLPPGLFFVPTVLHGQTGNVGTADLITATWVSDPSPPRGWTVGDRIPLRLQLKNSGPLDITVAWPTLPTQWGPFEVAAQERSAAEILAGGGMGIVSVDVILWTPGSHETPPLELTYTTRTGVSAPVAAQPLTIAIASVLSTDERERETARRALKAQAALPQRAAWPWLVVGGVGGLLLGGGGWWFWRQRGRHREPQPLGAAPPLPRAIAHAELDRIEALQLPAQGKTQQQTILVADCLRGYLEAVTAVPATERTTAELLRALRQRPLEPLLPKLTACLETADLVKFAGGMAGEPMNLAPTAVAHVRQLIDEIESCLNSPTPGG